MSVINPNAQFIDGGVEIRCEHCGRYADVQRQSAFFCDSKCKNAFHNAKRKRKKDIRLAFHSLETLIANLPTKGDSDEWNALAQMKQMIQDAMWVVEK